MAQSVRGLPGKTVSCPWDLQYQQKRTGVVDGICNPEVSGSGMADKASSPEPDGLVSNVANWQALGSAGELSSNEKM